MRFAIDDTACSRAKNAHELYIINVLAFHLLLAPAAIALDIGLYALLLSPAISLLVIGFIALRSRWLRQHGEWFVMIHWRLALRRALLLLAAYGASGAILLLVWLLTSSMEGHSRDMMLTVFTRIAIMPTFIMLLITFVLEMSSLGQAGRGEVPDRLLARWPAPDDMTPLAEPDGEDSAGGAPDEAPK